MCPLFTAHIYTATRCCPPQAPRRACPHSATMADARCRTILTHPIAESLVCAHTLGPGSAAAVGCAAQSTAAGDSARPPPLGAIRQRLPALSGAMNAKPPAPCGAGAGAAPRCSWLGVKRPSAGGFRALRLRVLGLAAAAASLPAGGGATPSARLRRFRPAAGALASSGCTPAMPGPPCAGSELLPCI